MRTRLLVVAVLGLAFAGSAAAATISVTNPNDSGTGSLRQAIADAVSGDTITFSLPPNSSITLTSDELLINKNLTIEGPGADQLAVRRSSADGTPEFRIFEIARNCAPADQCPPVIVTITGLTIANGRTFLGGFFGAPVFYNGGGILNLGTLTVNKSTISGNIGTSSGGGGIDNYTGATLTITNSTVSDNSTDGGSGGILNFGTLTITNSTISHNSRAGYGGGIGNSGSLTITNSTVSGNSAPNSAGGGISMGENATVHSRNTIIALNTAPTGPDINGPLASDGFNLIGNSKDATITKTTGDQIGTPGSTIDPKLDPNGLQNNGGPTQTHALLSGSPAIEKGHSSGSGRDQRGLPRPVDDPAIDNASGGDGADIGAYEVQADQLPGCKDISRVVSNNNDSGAGSLRDVITNVCAGSTITFADNVRGAINLTSGELMVNRTLTISGPGANLLSVQRSTDSGTAEFRIFGIGQGNIDVTLSGLTVANGKTSEISGSGAGIRNPSGGTLTLMGCAVSGNTASGNGTQGGGIFNLGTMILISSTISGNSAPGGGRIENLSVPGLNSTLTISNSTISGNSSAGTGAGIENYRVVIPNQPVPVGTVNITNSTLSGNSAGSSGGGIVNPSGNTLSVRNTIIALNTAPTGPDVQGALTSQNFNVIGSSAGTTISPAQFSDQIGISADQLKLGELQDNGGPTQTHALLSGSLAIDKGHSTGSSTDQRGSSRPGDQPNVDNAAGGDGADIGAYEVEGPTPTPTATPTATATATASPTATPTPTTTPSIVARLGNISTRLRVETGDNVLIGGFIITGSQAKKLIVRGIGPSLEANGEAVPGRLQDPALELYRVGNPVPIEVNDNWVEAGNKQEIIDSTVAPTNDFESAILISLEPDSYTAIVRGVGGSTGVGLVEVYDLDSSVDSKLAQISTRGFVQTGADVMIGGLYVVGSAAQKVIVRAIGPSLAIDGKLLDPTLELRDANAELLQANDNWRTGGQEQEIIDTTVPPTDDAESAIVQTLAPGPYTAIVRGVNDTIGIALVEVYGLD